MSRDEEPDEAGFADLVRLATPLHGPPAERIRLSTTPAWLVHGLLPLVWVLSVLAAVLTGTTGSGVTDACTAAAPCGSQPRAAAALGVLVALGLLLPLVPLPASPTAAVASAVLASRTWQDGERLATAAAVAGVLVAGTVLLLVLRGRFAPLPAAHAAVVPEALRAGPTTGPGRGRSEQAAAVAVVLAAVCVVVYGVLLDRGPGPDGTLAADGWLTAAVLLGLLGGVLLVHLAIGLRRREDLWQLGGSVWSTTARMDGPRRHVVVPELGLQARTTRGLALPLLGGTPALGASPLPPGSTREAVLLGDPRAGGTVLVVLPEGVVRPAAPLGPQRRA